MIYQNPIISGFNPDPSICRAGEDYYLVTSSFEYFPGVPIYHSKDLINWEHIGYCLTRESQLPLENAGVSKGIWAPTIRYNNGIFYMTTTNMTKGGNFFVTATDPYGEWSDPIYVDMGGIDPSFFFDDDQKVYFLGNPNIKGRSKIAMSEINIKTGDLLSEPKCLWSGTGGCYPEAQHLYKKDGYYYLMIAEGGTQYGHMITIARSKNIWGPYESCPRNPILTHREKVSEIQGTGHGDIIQAHDGSWWLVCLGFRNSANYFHHLGRETFLAPMKWDNDGWPIIYNGNGIETEMDCKCLPLSPSPEIPVRDDFERKKFGLQWNFLRNPNMDNYSLSDGKLVIKGTNITLNDLDSPTFICRRQQHFDCRISTVIDFKPKNINDETGLTLFQNNEHHYEIAVIQNEKGWELIVRKNIADMKLIVFNEMIEQKPIILEIIAEKEIFHFRYGYDLSAMKEIATGLTKFISTEVSGITFTGVFTGVYTIGEGCTAYIDWFDYENIRVSKR